MNTSSSSLPPDVPRPSIADVQRLAAVHLSPVSRVGYTVLLVVSLTTAVAMGSLWVTEPSLPARTHAAFAVMVTMSLTWATLAGWVLMRRRVLLGIDRVLSATVGVVFSGIAAVGMASVGYWGGAGRPAYGGALVDVGLCAVAVLLLIRARRRLAELARRRTELEGL
jgi:hypothetical protein